MKLSGMGNPVDVGLGDIAQTVFYEAGLQDAAKHLGIRGRDGRLVNYSLRYWFKFNPNSHLQEGECVCHLTVLAHGVGGDKSASMELGHAYKIGDGEPVYRLFEKGDVQQISDLFAADRSNFKGPFNMELPSIKYCKGCTVELLSCNLGRYPELMDNLKRKTGCKVILYPWLVNRDRNPTDCCLPASERSEPTQKHPLRTLRRCDSALRIVIRGSWLVIRGNSEF